MDEFELAWKVIDFFQKDYLSKEDMIAEIGDLDDLAVRIAEAIENLDLTEDDGIEFVAAQVEMELF